VINHSGSKKKAGNFLTLTEVLATLTEGFLCFFLSCKANRQGKTRKDGARPALCNFCVVLCIVCFVLFYVLFVLCCSMYCLFCVVLCVVCFVLFYVLFVLCCSMYCLFCVVLCIVCFVSFCVLFVCECVLYYRHRVATQLQSTNISHVAQLKV
jgi:hypothetical protein